MGLAIRPIVAENLRAATEFLAENLGGIGGPSRYERILNPRWADERPNHGFALQDEAGIQGVLGLVYSERVIKGERFKFCNMSSWCVVDAHRRSSLLLLRAMADQPGYVFTNFSPTPTVATVLERTGFRRLDVGKYLMFPPMRACQSRAVRVVERPSEVREYLAPDELKIFADHARYKTGQFVIDTGRERCYVVTVKRGKRGIYFADVLHASRPRVLAQNLGTLFWPALRRHGTFALGVDTRLISAAPSIVPFMPRPSFFMSDSIQPDQLSSIYTEIVGIYG